MSDLTIYRGDTVKLNAVVSSAGEDYNLTGCSLWFTAKRQYSDEDASAIFQKSTAAGGIVITNPTQGVAQVTIASTDTAGISNVKTILLWDLQIKDSQGQIYTAASGRLIVLPEVTRAT